MELGLGKTVCKADSEKDVFGRYLQVIKLRKLDLSEDIATKRPRWVYYILMSGSHHWLLILFIIPDGVGWLQLLISIEWQCEGLMTGISRGSFSHVFLFPILAEYEPPRQGERVGSKKSPMHE